MFKKLIQWLKSWFISGKPVEDTVKLRYPVPCKRRPPAQKIEFMCSICLKKFNEYISYFPQLDEDFIYRSGHTEGYFYNNIRCNDCHGCQTRTQIRSQSQGLPVTTDQKNANNNFIDIPEVE